MSLPDGLDVHGLRVPQSLPGGGGRGRSVTTVGLAVSRVGRVHVVVVMVVVWSMTVAVVKEQRRVCLCRVHTLHGGVHVIDQLLEVHIVICGRGTGMRGRLKKLMVNVAGQQTSTRCRLSGYQFERLF